jgi:hypothetical protein
MNKEGIAEMNMQSMAYAIEQRESYGLASSAQAELERRKLKADILAVTETLRILEITDKKEREAGLLALKKQLEALVTGYFITFE